MPFPRKLLNDGEDVVAELHPHWWVFAKPAVTVVLLFVLAVVGQNAIGSTAGMVFAGLGLLALLWLGVRYLTWATTVFVITTDRLILRSGVLAKHGKEIPLERLNDIAVSQTFFERVIRSGDVTLESGGERGSQVVSNISRPFEVQNVIYAEIERAQNRTADRIGGGFGGRELSVPEQLEKLDELRQRGVLTQAEFDAKKAQLLDRM